MREKSPKQMIVMLTVPLILIMLWAAPASFPGSDERESLTPSMSAGERREHSGPQNAEALSAEVIINRVVEANRRRDLALQRYTATRNYHAINLRLKKKAEMQAQVRFESPATKQFTVLSEEGSDAIRKMVFRGMMDSEVEALEPEMKRRSAISNDNYRFKWLGRDDLDGRPCYMLEAEPKRKDKFLFRGRLWIDAEDFAVMKLRGSPAKLPSVWTRKVELERAYQKIQDFWLPAKDEAESQVVIFGKSRLVITHSNYQVEKTRAGDPSGQ